ncbi:NAD(P)-dependent oxidoreductase [Candidatus Uhrbacteria bacterium]|nr:NAD(P)-dependent oxidoreductase [Candidatus Uhrbacteria bacterium]
MAMETSNDSRIKIALVTGACGFMGPHMVDILREHGWFVIATDIVAPTGYKPPWHKFHLADLANQEEVLELASFIKKQSAFLNAVFDVKGLFDYSSPIEALRRANVRGSQNLYDMLAEFFPGTKVVLWSAAGIYGDFPQVPAREDAPKNPKAAYLVSKLEQEEMAFADYKNDLCVSSLRPAGVYGPRARYGVAMSIMLASRGMMGPVFMGSGKNRVSMVHGRDVCNAALFLANQPWPAVHCQPFNVGDNSAYTIEELSRFIAREVGFPFAPWLRLPFSVMVKTTQGQMKQAEKKKLVSLLNEEMLDLLKLEAFLDLSKIRALGWTPEFPDSFQGLRKTIQAYREEGWL